MDFEIVEIHQMYGACNGQWSAKLKERSEPHHLFRVTLSPHCTSAASGVITETENPRWKGQLIVLEHGSLPLGSWAPKDIVYTSDIE